MVLHYNFYQNLIISAFTRNSLDIFVELLYVQVRGYIFRIFYWYMSTEISFEDGDVIFFSGYFMRGRFASKLIGYMCISGEIAKKTTCICQNLTLKHTLSAFLTVFHMFVRNLWNILENASFVNFLHVRGGMLTIALIITVQNMRSIHRKQTKNKLPTISLNFYQFGR